MPELSYIPHMTDTAERTAKTVRIQDHIYHRAKVAAVTSRKSLGQWLEEAIEEKVGRETG